MPKNTKEDKLKQNLNYLGFNLERIPKILKEFNPFSFRTAKSYDDTSYKVYRYISVTDIQILLTPTDRLTDLNQKYKLSAPIGAYLDAKSEVNIERFTIFLQMLENMNISKIEELEREQAKFKKQIPYEVKYPNNYIWQIYYSDVSNQYFMLVPTNETNNSAFFYLLKKQIESSKSRRKEYIFAPVTHQEYSGNYLVQSQISDLENYLWYFTKQWPNIYEVYDTQGKMTLTIVGKAKVYHEVESDYVIRFQTKDQAIEWYKLVKALFILATGLTDSYQFQTNISKEGNLEFWKDEMTKMEYATLPIFIKEQVEEKKKQIEEEEKKLTEEQKKLEKLKQITEKQTEDFLNKQRQIATFLACKKSFFGKIKYYFGGRKKKLELVKNSNEKAKEEKEESSYLETVEEARANYTIEDLIEVCTKLDSRAKIVKNLQMDSKALELKKINLERKIKNANIYLNEIELHKKSIFEFWKFTAKDELPSLNEGEEEQNEDKEKIGKSFVYEEDIEDLGKQMDELQRRKLSKNETDAIFAIKQALRSSRILHQTKSKDLSKSEMLKLEQELKLLKKEYEENFETITIKDFDIFGGIFDDQTKVKMLHNEKHRESEKDKYKILNITPDTELEVYIDNLRNALKLVQEAFCKIVTPFEMPIYIAEEEKLEQNNLSIANLNATEAIYQKVKQIGENTNLQFYTLFLPKEAPLLYYTNITQYDNLNQTLPVGMDVTTEVLIDLKDYILEQTGEKDFRINYQSDEYTNQIIEVHAVEYSIKRKEEKTKQKGGNQ